MRCTVGYILGDNNLTRTIKVCNDKIVVMEATTITERKYSELQITVVA